MSKLAKKPILMPDGVNAELNDNKLEISGKRGNLILLTLPYVKVEINEKREVILSPLEKHKQARANLGTMAALTHNALMGVNTGFSKNLEIEGIGFRASMEGENLLLNVGFTHPVKFAPPTGIKITVEKNIIKVNGLDKNLVGQIAAQIRKIKKPEPYQGKGIHYVGELIRRKAGKKVAGTGTGT